MWNMLPYFAPSGTSWEGHLSGAVTGTICALAFMNHGPQKPEPFANEEEEEEVANEANETDNDEINSDETDQKTQSVKRIVFHPGFYNRLMGIPITSVMQQSIM